MKGFLLLLMLFVVNAYGATETINWWVDNSVYHTTTCAPSDNITPPTAPVKNGYTFVGWSSDTTIYGTGSQSGTPTPTNPIYPTFYQSGNLILRALGNNNDLIADSYDLTTNKITRRVGVMVLDGTEDWGYGVLDNAFYLLRTDQAVNASYLCSHFKGVSTITGNYQIRGGENWSPLVRYNEMTGDIALLKPWLAQQYANGTPVTIYYPLATPVEEDYVQN